MYWVSRRSLPSNTAAEGEAQGRCVSEGEELPRRQGDGAQAWICSPPLLHHRPRSRETGSALREPPPRRARTGPEQGRAPVVSAVCAADREAGGSEVRDAALVPSFVYVPHPLGALQGGGCGGDAGDEGLCPRPHAHRAVVLLGERRGYPWARKICSANPSLQGEPRDGEGTRMAQSGERRAASAAHAAGT
jgi:hypothetical protein